MLSDRRTFLKTGMLTSLGLTIGFPAAGVAVSPADQPQVVPALKSFTGTGGRLTLGPASRIVAQGDATAGIARTLAADYAELTGRRIRVAASPARDGDIVLRLDTGLRQPDGGLRFAEEGYRIDTGDRVVLTAPTPTGLYWATRSLLQQLVAEPGRSTLLRGVALDWPDYPKRGFMLDVGRRYFTPEFLRDYISLMSWFKMNEFQIHLMDNGFLEKDSLDWSRVQRGFRLKSSKRAFAGLAARDGAYDRRTWNALEDHAARRFIRIIPELEGPAHALSVIGWKPQLGLTGKQGDHLDLANPESLATMKAIFSEFVPWFRGTDVHIGVDEYYSSPELFRDYYNQIAAHVRGLGKHPRAWGSFSKMTGSPAGHDRDVTVNCWNNDWYNMVAAANDGFGFINTNDALLYVVPYADYYRGNGLDNRDLYLNWNPSLAGKIKVPRDAPLGSMWAVWNDITRRDYTEFDVHGMIELSFPVMAQKNWNGAAPELGFEAFGDRVARVGLGPARRHVRAVGIGRQGDLMLAATVTANASRRHSPAHAVNDREPATCWRAPRRAGRYRIDADLGAALPVRTIEIERRGDQRLSYTLEASADGAIWRTVPEGPTEKQGVDVFRPFSSPLRYIRLRDIVSDHGAPSVVRMSAFGT